MSHSITEEPSDELWKAFLSTFPGGNFEQSCEYGEITKNAFPNSKALRLGITHDGEMAGIIQGTYSKYLGFGMTLLVERGPIINAERGEKARIAKSLLEAMEDVGKKRRIIQAQILLPETFQLQQVFQELGYSNKGEINEYFVNVRKSAEELWRSISHNKRRNIKKAMKEGVEVIRSHDVDDLLTFYSMLEDTQRRRGFSTYPLSWFEAAWTIREPEELARVFLARLEGETISGIFVVTHGKNVYALAAASLEKGWRVRPNDLMHWKAMEWACETGFSKYYMGRVKQPPPNQESRGWGVWRWKREWMGDLEKMIIMEKTFLGRYKLVLKAKGLAERCLAWFKKS